MKLGTYEVQDYGLPLAEIAEPSPYAHLSRENERDELRASMLRHGAYANRELSPEILERIEQRIDAVLEARLKPES